MIVHDFPGIVSALAKRSWWD